MTFDSWLAVALYILSIPTAIACAIATPRFQKYYDRFIARNERLSQARLMLYYERVKHYRNHPEELTVYLFNSAFHASVFASLALLIGVFVILMRASIGDSSGLSAPYSKLAMGILTLAGLGVMVASIAMLTTICDEATLLARRFVAFRKFRAHVCKELGEPAVAEIDKIADDFEEHLSIK